MPKTSEKIKVALVGFGYWGPNLVRNFLSSGLYEVVGIVDLSEDSRGRASQLYPGIKILSDYQELLLDPDLELVAVATPVESHYEIAKAALLASKHVLVEKPLTDSQEKAEELLKIAEQVSRKIAVDHTFLYSPAVRKIKEIIESGDLGDIYEVSSERLNLGKIQRHHNVVWDLAVHDLSILSYLFGGKLPERNSLFAYNFTEAKQAEVAHLYLDYGKTKVCIHVSWLSPLKVRRMTILGSKKMLYYDDVEADNKIQLIDKGVSFLGEGETALRPVYRNGDLLIPHLVNTEPLQIEARELFEYLRNDKPLVSDGNFGKAMVKILTELGREKNG
jgi:predicted dehydrogenase